MKILFCLFFLFLFSCLSSFVFNKKDINDDFVSEDYVSMAHDVIAKTARKISKELGAECIGTGGGMMDTVYRITMNFQFCQQVELERAREIIIFVLDVFLNNINSCKKIRPYLHSYPFTIKDVNLVVFFIKPNGEKVDFGKVKTVRARSGTISYDIREVEVRKYSDPYWKEETLEEALQLIEEQKKQKAQEGKR